MRKYELRDIFSRAGYEIILSQKWLRVYYNCDSRVMSVSRGECVVTFYVRYKDFWYMPADFICVPHNLNFSSFFRNISTYIWHRSTYLYKLSRFEKGIKQYIVCTVIFYIEKCQTCSNNFQIIIFLLLTNVEHTHISHLYNIIYYNIEIICVCSLIFVS